MPTPEEVQFRNENYVTTGQAAAMLKVSGASVVNLIEDGALQAYRLRKRGWYMVSRISIQQLIKRWYEESHPAMPSSNPVAR